MLVDDVLKEVAYTPYSKLSIRERSIQELQITKSVIAICGIRKKLKDNRMDYIRNNNELAEDALVLLDAVKAQLQK